MKGRINLLYKARSYKKRERLFEQFRKVVLIFGVTTFLILGALFYLQLASTRQYKNLLSQKENLIRELLPTKDRELKLLFVQDRAHNFESITRAKTYFGSYYRFLQGVYPAASSSSALSDFSINSKNDFSATFDFATIDEALEFMNTIETKEFIDAFGEVRIGTITISNEKTAKPVLIQLTLTGKVKQTI
jgi:hypothetical protein